MQLYGQRVSPALFSMRGIRPLLGRGLLPDDELTERVAPALRVLIVTVVIVLAIVCTNVANLLLARGTQRQQEIAIRRSPGATRGRIARQVLTESLVLSGLAAVVAAVVALGGVRLLKATAIGYVNPRFASTAGVLPRIDEISIDPIVLVFVVGLALAAGALFGLLPAIIGIYGVLSYLVSQRTKEIGIRMALGAQRTAVLKLVLGQGAVIIAIGIACGVATAMALTSYLEGMLFGLRALDLPTYTVVAGAFAIIAMLSVYLPARRATVVDPLDALRHE